MNLRERVYVALGSNMGDRDAYLAKAREALAKLPLTTVLAESKVEETEPVGPVPQGKFLNQMILVETGLDPGRFLKLLHKIEDENGRSREATLGAPNSGSRYRALRHPAPAGSGSAHSSPGAAESRLVAAGDGGGGRVGAKESRERVMVDGS